MESTEIKIYEEKLTELNDKLEKYHFEESVSSELWEEKSKIEFYLNRSRNMDTILKIT